MGLLITFAGAVLTVGICIALAVFLDKDPTDPLIKAIRNKIFKHK